MSATRTGIRCFPIVPGQSTPKDFFLKIPSFPPKGQLEIDSLIPFQTITFLVLKTISPPNLAPVVLLAKKLFLVRVRNGQRRCYYRDDKTVKLLCL